MGEPQGLPVYVNGQTGSDENEGTKDKPVKTLGKAKELLDSSGGTFAYVTGALVPAGKETWDFDGRTLLREPGYTGELVRVEKGASLKLANITLDGNSVAGAGGKSSNVEGGGGSLVGVYEGSLSVGAGSTLQNNEYLAQDHWYPEAGGGVFAYGANSFVTLDGGEVSGNKAVRGGGVYVCDGATLTVNAGKISSNTALKSTGDVAELSPLYGGFGGGVCAFDGGKIVLRGGTIENNEAKEAGGGISLGTVSVSTQGQNTLDMSGGSITDNSAGSCGGGLYVQAGNSASSYYGLTNSIAHVTEGIIANNKTLGTGKDSGMFGGGGIYVNGYTASYTGYASGELYLENAAIYDNTAQVYGGGYAGCPVSETSVYLTSGAAFFSNKATEGANELYILASNALGAHGGNPNYEVSPSMLGGGAYRWAYDDGTEAPLDDLKGTLSASANESLSLDNPLTKDDESVKRALSQAKVFIYGNSSVTRGGGIGSNGKVTIGTSSETTEVAVTKVWDVAEGQSLPSLVEVELWRNGEYVGFQTITAGDDGSWKTTFANLPAKDAEGNAYAYTVREREPEGYVSAVTGSAGEGFVITNSLKPAPDPEPGPGPTPDPDPAPNPDPAPGPDPEPEPDPAPDPDPDPEPEPEPDPAPDPEPEPDPAPEPDSGSSDPSDDTDRLPQTGDNVHHGLPALLGAGGLSLVAVALALRTRNR